jgi:hypothetical protein
VSSEPGQATHKTTIVEFWQGFRAQIDLNDIAGSAVAVKGRCYHSPLRFLEIYGNLPSAALKDDGRQFKGLHDLSWSTIERIFIPRIPGVRVTLREGVYQPPFIWRDCDARTLCVNFTYNTNALYRILSNLCDQDKIPANALDDLLDRACLALSHIYKARNHFIMRNMNNNYNMFLISKVIEFLVGKEIYDSEMQEYPLTQRSLATSLAMAKEYAHVDTVEKMSIALGKGVSFIERRLSGTGIRSQEMIEIKETSYQYYDRGIAIDDRHLLLNKIADASRKKDSFVLAVILDDASEAVDDLLWMLDLMEQFPFFKVHLLVNTAQVSINFSSHMIPALLQSPVFARLGSRLGSQLFVTKVFCPFISFQTNYLPPSATEIINRADAVYIKGANFFETCQIIDKDAFHAFVVYGPISRKYTGLNDFDAVFAYVPAGHAGYVHHPNPRRIITLGDSIAAFKLQRKPDLLRRNRRCKRY